MSDNTDWTPSLNSTPEDRLGRAEDHIRYLNNVLTRVQAERDEARADLEHLERVGNVLNTKRRHP